MAVVSRKATLATLLLGTVCAVALIASFPTASAGAVNGADQAANRALLSGGDNNGYYYAKGNNKGGHGNEGNKGGHGNEGNKGGNHGGNKGGNHGGVKVVAPVHPVALPVYPAVAKTYGKK